MYLVFKDDTDLEMHNSKKLFAFIFSQNFEYCETKQKPWLKLFQVYRANLQDPLQPHIFTCKVCITNKKISKSPEVFVGGN